ncbi:MAG: aminoacyl-tRNA hydrolase [Gammaproteobacteria bacterium]|nr:aminoacyl-tRNA hydrolase [Gammaproteobacteria bacterium]
MISGEGWSLRDNEIEFTAIRASGPGGQAVNKTSSAIQLRFDIHSSSLPEWLKQKLLERSDRRINQSGHVVIKAQSYRSQEANQLDALERLRELISQAARRNKVRRPTSPTRASVRRRLDSKKKRSDVKSGRGNINW